MGPVSVLSFARVSRILLASALLSVSAEAQTGIIFTTAQFSGEETLIDFEGYAPGTRISNQYESLGVTFSLSDGTDPWIETIDQTARQFAPQGSGLLQNFAPGTTSFPDSLPDLEVNFTTPVNRAAFEIKNNLDDDLIIVLHCFNDDEVVGTQLYSTSFGFRFLGLESAQPFDRLTADVTDVINGAFRLDNLRFECDPMVAIVDSLPPRMQLVEPADGLIVGGTTVPVTVDVIDASPTTVTSTPAGLSASLPHCGGTASGSVALPVEGANLITVQVTDAAGNSSGSSVTVIRDTLSPGITVLSPDPGAVLAASPSILTVSVEDATATSVSFGGNSFELESGSGIVSGAVSLVEGANTISITATDAVGNTTTTQHVLVLDLSSPLVTIDSPADGAVLGAGDALAAVTVSVDDLTGTTVSSDPSGVDGTLPAGGGILTGAVALAEGSNTITVSAVDGAGRSGSSSVLVLLDTTGPSASIGSPNDGETVRGTIEFAATAVDVAPGTGVSQIDFLLDGSVVASFADPGVTVLTDVDTIGLSDGYHQFAIVATDGVGNVTSTSVSAYVDNTDPGVVISSLSEGDLVSGLIELDVTATDAGAGVTSVQTLVAGEGPNVQNGSEELEEGVPSITITSIADTTAYLDGLLSVSVSAIDEAGNEVDQTILVEVDNTAPSKTLVAPVHGDTVSGTIDIVTEASDDNFASLQIFANGVLLGSTAANTYSLAFDTTTVTDGPLVILVVASDLAGNRSTCSATVNVDNAALEISPRTLFLSSRGKKKSVTMVLEGAGLDSLLPIEESDLVLVVPGGSPVPATAGFAGDDAIGDSDGDGIPDLVIKFDRQLLISALRAGVNAGMVQTRVPVEVKAYAGGNLLGADNIVLR